MGIYINSKGEEIDTSEMNDVYLMRAYDKALEDGNADNISALSAELTARGEN